MESIYHMDNSQNHPLFIYNLINIYATNECQMWWLCALETRKRKGTQKKYQQLKV